LIGATTTLALTLVVREARSLWRDVALGDRLIHWARTSAIADTALSERETAATLYLIECYRETNRRAFHFTYVVFASFRCAKAAVQQLVIANTRGEDVGSPSTAAESTGRG